MLDKTQADRRQGLFGGTGAVLVWDLLGPQTIPPFSAVLACELEPGASVGVHVQEHDPEIVVCLEGVGGAEVDGKPHTLSPGVVVALPLGQTLALRNAAAHKPLRYLIIKAVAP